MAGLKAVLFAEYVAIAWTSCATPLSISEPSESLISLNWLVLELYEVDPGAGTRDRRN